MISNIFKVGITKEIFYFVSLLHLGVIYSLLENLNVETLGLNDVHEESTDQMNWKRDFLNFIFTLFSNIKEKKNFSLFCTILPIVYPWRKHGYHVLLTSPEINLHAY